MRTSFIATLVAGTLLSHVMAFHAQATDLLQIYREALANDAQYSSARAALAAGLEKIPQGRAGLLPGVNLSGNYNRTGLDTSQAGFDSNRNFSSNGYTLSLSQPLIRWANWEQYQQSKLLAAASEAQFAQAQQDLVVRVSQAYFDVLAAQDALAFVQAQKIAITEQLASAKRNFEVGTATITDTHEAQARYDLANAQEFTAQNDLAIKQTALQQIIGKPAPDLATLRAGVRLSAPEPAQIDKWVDSAETQNYGVVGQQLGVEIARREIRKNRAGHTPTLDLVASSSHSNQGATTTSASSSLSTSNAIGVQWTIPIFSGFAIDSKVRESIALEEKARFDLENARRNAAQGARQSFLSVNNGLAQVNALEAAEVSSLSALESNKLGYQVGVRINIDVLNAQQQLFSTRRDLAKARYDTIVNGLRLKSAAGTLKEEDLAQVNMLLADAQTGAAPIGRTIELAAKTPAPVDGGTAAKTTAADSADHEAILSVLNGWRDAWSARDVQTYLDFYGSDFELPAGRSRAAWSEERRARIEGKKRIEIKVAAPQITVKGDIATVKFRQTYRSGRSVATSSNKTLVLARQDGKWKIRQERSNS